MSSKTRRNPRDVHASLGTWLGMMRLETTIFAGSPNSATAIRDQAKDETERP